MVSPINLKGNDWVFLTVTHDGRNTVSFYIDGELDSTAEIAPAGTNDGPFIIGSGKHPAGDYGAGTVDEFAMFHRELDKAEILKIMKDGAQPFIAVEPAGKLTTTWGDMKTTF